MRNVKGQFTSVGPASRRAKDRARHKLTDKGRSLLRGCIGCGAFFSTKQEKDACGQCRTDALYDPDMALMLQQRRGLINGMANGRAKDILEEAALKAFPHHGHEEPIIVDENGREVKVRDYLTRLYDSTRPAVKEGE